MKVANLKKPKRVYEKPNQFIGVAVCGHYAQGKSLADGQTIKTQTIINTLIDLYGEDKVTICDTYKWKHNPLRVFFGCIKAARSSSNVIILPAKNGIRVFIPLFYMLSKVYKTKLHYSVIGGWLPGVLKKHKRLLKYLGGFKSIHVETAKMKEQLSDFELSNIYVTPNFKNIQPISKTELRAMKAPVAPYALCTFSRVIAEKGIDEAIEAVSRVNDYFGKTVYTLDIYGSIGIEYKDHFDELMKASPTYISYRGTIESGKTVEVLKDYYLLLFPTHYPTEGLPGTIIDAYAAGLPVVSSRWNSFSDIITEGVTGYGIEIGDGEMLFKILHNLLDTNKVLPLKERCISSFEPFSYKSGRENLARSMEDI